MSYEFVKKDIFAVEWGALDEGIRDQFKAKLRVIQQNPYKPEYLFNEVDGRYKISLPRSNWVLLYAIDRPTLCIMLLGVKEELTFEKLPEINF